MLHRREWFSFAMVLAQAFLGFWKGGRLVVVVVLSRLSSTLLLLFPLVSILRGRHSFPLWSFAVAVLLWLHSLLKAEPERLGIGVEALAGIEGFLGVRSFDGEVFLCSYDLDADAFVGLHSFCPGLRFLGVSGY